MFGWFNTFNEEKGNGLVLALQELDLGVLFQDPVFRNSCLDRLKDFGCKPPANHLVLAILTPVISKTGKLVSQHAMSRAISLLAANKTTGKFAEWLIRTGTRVGADQQYREYVQQQIKSGEYEHMQIRTDCTWSSAELADLNIQNSLARIHKKLGVMESDIRNLVNAQNEPVLENRGETRGRQSSATRFYFGNSLDKFVGRQDELNLIDAFLHEVMPEDDRNRFRWQLIHAEGGTGKSRLALEALRRAGHAWRCGFVNMDSIGQNHIHAWRPTEPTFMVVDYASQHHDLVGNLILALTNNAGKFDFPVRILLLERFASGQWYDELFAESRGGDTRTRWQSRYREPWPISAIDDDDLIVLMAERMKRAAREEKQEPPHHAGETLLAALIRVDEHKRPLFAAMTGDAVGRGDEPGTITRQNVFKNFLDREEAQYWHNAGSRAKLPAHKNLLALVTLSRGLPKDKLETELPQQANLPDFTNRSHDVYFEPNLYMAMSGQPADKDLAPLLPDLVGEFFVLDWLKNALPKERQELVDIAWRHGSINTALSLVLLAQDYPDQLVDLDFLKPGPSTDGQALLWFALASIDLITAYGKAGQLDAARELHEWLQDQARESGNVDVLVEAAAGAVNLVNAYGKAGQLDAARELHEWQKEQARESGNVDVLVRAAAGAVNLITAYGKAGQLDAAREVHEWLQDQAHESGNVDVLVEAAKGAFNLITAYGNAGQLDAAREVHEWLQDQARESGNVDVLVEAAAGAFNLFAMEQGNRGAAMEAAEALPVLISLCLEQQDANMLNICVTAFHQIQDTWKDDRELHEALKPTRSMMEELEKAFKEKEE